MCIADGVHTAAATRTHVVPMRLLFSAIEFAGVRFKHESASATLTSARPDNAPSMSERAGKAEKHVKTFAAAPTSLASWDYMKFETRTEDITSKLPCITQVHR